MFASLHVLFAPQHQFEDAVDGDEDDARNGNEGTYLHIVEVADGKRPNEGDFMQHYENRHGHCQFPRTQKQIVILVIGMLGGVFPVLVEVVLMPVVDRFVGAFEPVDVLIE